MTPLKPRLDFSNRPLLLGVGLALFLFLLFIPDVLKNMSSMGLSYAFDYFTLPRCGIAMRFGTNPFTSSEDYKWFGYHATNWVSHPMMCLFPGILFSYLPPWPGFWLMNLVYLGIHIFTLVVFGRNLAPVNGKYGAKDYVTFASLGFFFPMYLIYTLGQYHAFAMLAMTLVLMSERTVVVGFVLSALGKPLLGPAGLVLAARGEWKKVWKIAAWCALGYLPFLFLTYDLREGLRFGLNQTALTFFESGSIYAKYTVYRWNQEMSLAKVFDEFLSANANLTLRYFLVAIPILGSLLLPRKAPMGVAFCLAGLWFFVFYGRGHEYHLPLYIPIITYLFTEARGLYRTQWMAFLTLVLALPSTYPIFFYFYFGSAKMPSSDEMLATNSLLYYLFIAHKPICALALVATILKTECFDTVRNLLFAKSSASPAQ